MNQANVSGLLAAWVIESEHMFHLCDVYTWSDLLIFNDFIQFYVSFEQNKRYKPKMFRTIIALGKYFTKEKINKYLKENKKTIIPNEILTCEFYFIEIE